MCSCHVGLDSSIYCIGDVRGHYKELDSLLKKIEADTRSSEDIIVFLGNLVGEGGETSAVLEKVKKIKKKYPERVIVLRGEDDWRLLRGRKSFRLETDKGLSILKSYRVKGKWTKESTRNFCEDLVFLNRLPSVYDTVNAVFTPTTIDLTKDPCQQLRGFITFNTKNKLDKELLARYGKKVVHGNSNLEKVHCGLNNFSVDTISKTKKLSCLVLDKRSGRLKHILSTSG